MEEVQMRFVCYLKVILQGVFDNMSYAYLTVILTVD